jgi:hypothetical protein
VGSATRTVNPLHFEDLEPHRFEDLIRQLAHDFRPWLRIEATGRLGKDEGVDIRAIEGVRDVAEPETRDEETDDTDPILVEREWRIQCKRYKTLRPKEMRQFVREAVGDGTPPSGLILAAACDVSAATLDAFHDEARALGVIERHLWIKAHVEDMLFRPENDGLLFAYFGISLTATRRSRLQDLRHDITLKRKLARLLEMTKLDEAANFEEFLVRDIEDTHFPNEDNVPNFDAMDNPPWHTVVPTGICHLGLMVTRWRFPGWARDDGTWDLLADHPRPASTVMGQIYRRETRDWWREPEIMERIPKEQRTVFSDEWILPLSNILIIDDFGDQAYAGPHLFCSFTNREGPYLGRALGMTYRRQWGGENHAAEENRRPLFKQIKEGTLVLPEVSKTPARQGAVDATDEGRAAL